MTFSDSLVRVPREMRLLAHWGMFWLAIACIGAVLFFQSGFEKLAWAWAKPEYSHGPLIPILSGLLFLRQLKDVPVNTGAVRDRWPGFGVLVLATLIGLLGTLSGIDDVVAYALIVWIWGILLISFGWKVGLLFWPPVLHLVYMLPLPDVFYYKLSTYLQFISSQLGVTFLQWLDVPVFLEGNIIDLGVYKLHVAEACSGLRYLFPILSFSYIFAVLYRGPVSHKAILLLSAVPITVLMNSVRIAVAGLIVNSYGVGYVEGFSHFFEGWVIFVICVVILFGLARLMLLLHPARLSLGEALDLDMSGLGAQAMRLRHLRPSAALIAGAMLMILASAAVQLTPERGTQLSARESFTFFPSRLGEWHTGPHEKLDERVARALRADDYLQTTLISANSDQPVGLFTAWYRDQSQGGIHSPEVCLPGAGWEIAWLERTDIGPRIGYPGAFNLNRAIIQKGETRMMVYYWFEQKGRKVAWDMAAKFYLLMDGITTGQTEGAIVRLTTLIASDESDAQAQARLDDVLLQVLNPMPRFIPGSHNLNH